MRDVQTVSPDQPVQEAASFMLSAKILETLQAKGLLTNEEVVKTIQAAMPTAVNMIVLAVEFDAWPEFVSNGVVVTTIGSLVSLTFLIAVFR